MFSLFKKSAPDSSDSELLERLAHTVDPRRFSLFSAIRSSGGAVREIRERSFSDVVRDLEEFRSSVSGHDQYAKLAEIPVRIDPDEDRVAFARVRNGGSVIL